MRLLVGVITGAHHRTDRGVDEAHRPGFAFKASKHIRMGIARHRQVVCRGLQVLAYGQHAHAMFAQVVHYRDDFLVGFTEAHHQPRFGRHLRMA